KEADVTDRITPSSSTRPRASRIGAWSVTVREMTDDGLRVSRLEPGVEEHLDWADSVASSVVETVRGVSPLGSWSYSVWRPPQPHGLIRQLLGQDRPSAHRLKRVVP